MYACVYVFMYDLVQSSMYVWLLKYVALLEWITNKRPLTGLILKQNNDLWLKGISGLHLRHAYHLEPAFHSKDHRNCT